MSKIELLLSKKICTHLLGDLICMPTNTATSEVTLIATFIADQANYVPPMDCLLSNVENKKAKRRNSAEIGQVLLSENDMAEDNVSRKAASYHLDEG